MFFFPLVKFVVIRSVLAFFLLTCGGIKAQPFIANYAVPDDSLAPSPLTEGGGSWVLLDSIGSAEADGDMWKIIDNSIAEDSRYQYAKVISTRDIQDMGANGWRMQAKIKMSESGDGAFVGCAVFNDTAINGQGNKHRWGVFIESSGGFTTFTADAGSSYTFPAAAIYQLVLIDTDGDGSASIWINGSALTNGETYTGTSNFPYEVYNNVSMITFGAGSSHLKSTSSWSNVSLEILPQTLVAPQITGVNPSFITGSNSPQSLYIRGSNFSSESYVALRDLGTGEVFLNRTIYNQSSSQIELRPIFTTLASSWSVEVVNQGVSSGPYVFNVNGELNPSTLPIVRYGVPVGGPVPSPLSEEGGDWYLADAIGSVAVAENMLQIIDDSSASNSRYQFAKDILSQDIQAMGANGWRMRVKMKMDEIGAGVFVGWGTSDDTLINGQGNQHRWGCFIESDGVDTIFRLDGGDSYTVSTEDVHDLTIVDLDGNGSASVWLNGVDVSGGETYVGSALSSNSNRMTFGAGSTPLKSTTLWSLVSLEALPVSSERPVITGISPDPVTGSNIAQNFYINGRNFTSSSTITLRDLRSGEVFPNRAIYSQTSTQIKLRPIFTTEAATWSVEILDKGVSSGQHQFTVLSPGVEEDFFYIEGPASITSGETAEYKCYMRNLATSEVIDVSSLCTIGFVGQTAGSGLSGKTVWAGPVDTSTNITLQAYYTRPDDRIGSSTFTVTITPPQSDLDVDIYWMTDTPINGTNHQINMIARATGGTPPYTYTWDLDKDGSYDDGTGDSVSTNTSEAGTYRYKVKVTDASASTDTAKRYTTINSNPVDAPPVADVPDPQPPAFKTWNGTSYDDFVFDSSKRDNGLIVITHGIRSSGEAEWIQWMVHNIKTRTNGAQPNIVVYDWKENADVFISQEEKDEVYKIIKRDHPWGGRLITPSAEIIDTAADGIFSRLDHGPEEGGKLAAWIRNNLKTDQNPSGEIDPQLPIHLIGHSAGGFVVGECGWSLQHEDHYPRVFVDSVTTLDTPFVFKKHIRALASKGRFERYRSSILGQLFFGGDISDNAIMASYANYKVFDTQPLSSRLNKLLAFNFNAHGHAPLWYTESARSSNYHEEEYPNSSQWGFNLSPIINPAYSIDKSSFTSASRILNQLDSVANASIPVNGFTPYGTATEIQGLLTLTENQDAMLTKIHTIPVKAEYLNFKYRFSTSGDGDFFTIHYSDRSIFRATETSMNRGVWMTARIPIGEFSGETRDLVIRLVSRGQAQAVIEITDLQIEETEDLDGDGLLTDDEIIGGTDHRLWDTDGDFISDGDEAPDSDPLKKDTDGDGADDYMERLAGTSPTDNQSYLYITDVEMHANGTFDLTWSSVVGQKYRVQWSDHPAFIEYQSISGVITATSEFTSYSDIDADNTNRRRGFYRISVYSE